MLLNILLIKIQKFIDKNNIISILAKYISKNDKICGLIVK